MVPQISTCSMFLEWISLKISQTVKPFLSFSFSLYERERKKREKVSYFLIFCNWSLEWWVRMVLQAMNLHFLKFRNKTLDFFNAFKIQFSLFEMHYFQILHDFWTCSIIFLPSIKFFKKENKSCIEKYFFASKCLLVIYYFFSKNYFQWEI